MDNSRCNRIFFLFTYIIILVNSESLMGGHLDNQQQTSTTNKSSFTNNNKNNNHHHLPGVVPFAFNGGQPFSLEKDPVTGKINFDNAPPFKAINLTGTNDSTDDDDNDHNNNNNEDIELSEKIDRNDAHPNEINQYSPSFHDFLNLPVRYSDHEKYTSDKYPLISNSYANTKVQGGTSYKIYNSLNHKNYHPGKASTSQSYSNTRTPYVPRTTTTRRPTTTTVRTTTTATTTTTTTPRPTTTTTAKTTTIGTTVTTKKPTTTKAATTWKPRPVDRYTEDYDGESMLIEKIQNDGMRGDQQFDSFPKIDYDDGYEDYLHQEPETERPTSTSTMTTTTTTTTEPTTTSTMTPKTTEQTPEPDRETQSALISVKGPSLNNVIVNGHQNYPSYGGLVVESSSNVIVPPDQDTISFVLGNRQNVQGGYYGHGSALPESPYGEAVTVPNRMDFVEPPRPVKGNVEFPGPNDKPTFQFPRDPPNFQAPPYPYDQNQKWWFNNEQSEKSQSLPEVDKDNRVNVVAGYRVAFPTESSTQSTTFPSTTMIQESSEKPAMSELSDILVPPAADNPIRLPQPQRPHYYQHHHYHPRPSLPQRLPINHNGYKIRPPVDLNLPNILPQFRPNVKNPQRRGGEAIGTMIISNSPKHPPRVSVRPPIHPPAAYRPPPRRPAPVSPLQRLKPPPPPPPPPVHALRLPSPESLIDLRGQENEHSDGPIRRNVGGDGLIDERNRNHIVKSRLNDETTDKLELPSLPPQPPVFFKRKNTNDTRVTTLQMIQHHGVDVNANDDELISSDELIGESQNIDRRVGESPVFVVYPVKGAIDIHSDDSDTKNLDESVVIGTHGPQRPLPPDTLSQQADDDEMLPVSVKLASDFPYPLERPDPSLFVREKPLLVPRDQVAEEDEEGKEENEGEEGEDHFSENQRDKDTSINLIPYLQDHVPYAIKQNAISTTLHVRPNPLSASSSPPVTPIAYVYTPTVRDHRPVSSDIYDRSPVLLPSQQPSSSSSSAPSPQAFMAPFVASMSAEAPSRNGWSVVTLNPSAKPQDAEKRHSDTITESKSNLVNERSENSTAIDSRNEEKHVETGEQTESSDFDVENFKPELFGGFQPIFEFPSDSAEIPSELKNEEAVGVMDKPRGFKESSPRTSHET